MSLLPPPLTLGQARLHFSALGHNHDDRYYTEAQIDSLLDNYQPAGDYAPLVHTHDDRYYTETEVDSFFTSYYTDSEIDTLLAGYATTSDLTSGLGGKSDTGHIHDDRYYTETEIGQILEDYYTETEVDTLLSGYSATGHTHDAADVISGTLDNARVNWAAPSDIGTTTPPAANLTRLDIGAEAAAGFSAVNLYNFAGANLLEMHTANAVGQRLYAHSDTGFRGFSVDWMRSRGTYDVPQAVQNGDTLGYLSFVGHDGTNYGSAGVQIQAVAAQNFEVGKRGSWLDFLVANTDAASATAKMRILGSGKTIIGSNFSWNTARLNISHVSGETGLIIRSTANDAPHFQLQNSAGVVGVQATNDAYGLEFLRNSRTQKHRYQVYYDDTSGTLLYQSYNAYYTGSAWTRDNTAKEGVLQFMGNYSVYGDRALLGWFNVTGTSPVTVVPVMSISTIEPGVRIGNFTDSETNTAYGAQLFVRGRDTTLIPVRIRQSVGGTQEILRVENTGGTTAYMSVTPTVTTLTHTLTATLFNNDRDMGNTQGMVAYLRNTNAGANANVAIVFANDNSGNRANIHVNSSAHATRPGSLVLTQGADYSVSIEAAGREAAGIGRQAVVFSQQSNATSTAIPVWYFDWNSTGTPANGYGATMLFRLHSSTTEKQNAAFIEPSWSTATHASRVAQLALGVYNISTKTAVLTLTPTLGGVFSLGTANKNTKVTDTGIYFTRTSDGTYQQYIENDGNATLVMNARSVVDLRINGSSILLTNAGGMVVGAGAISFNTDVLATFRAGSASTLTNDTSSDVSVVHTLIHRSSGAGANNIGTGLLFAAETTTNGTDANAAQIDAVLTSAVVGSLVGQLNLNYFSGVTKTLGLSVTVNGLYVPNITAPSGTPSGGGYLYVESGALKYKGSSGTVTTLALA